MSKSLNNENKEKVRKLEQVSDWLELLHIVKIKHVYSFDYKGDIEADAKLKQYLEKYNRPFNHDQFKQDFRGNWIENV